MKIEAAWVNAGVDDVKFIFTMSKRDKAATTMAELFNSITWGGDYDVKITPHRLKRSLNANGYMWTLCDKIADKLKTSREEVYRRHIRANGTYADIAIQAKAVADFIENWNARGIGWFAEVFDSTISGCKRIRVYYGSSVYDTKEMSRLIEDVVYEAKNLGIETLTPDEINNLLEVKW